MTRDDTAKSIVFLIEKLLTLQLGLEYDQPRDAFSALMTNNLAAGYVFGFHDSCLQIFGCDPNDPDTNLGLIKASYQRIFGNQSGFALFDMSLHSQNDPDFQMGRLSGGEEFAEFMHRGIPPLGLQRILVLGFDAAAVWRGLKGKKR